MLHKRFRITIVTSSGQKSLINLQCFFTNAFFNAWPKGNDIAALKDDSTLATSL